MQGKRTDEQTPLAPGMSVVRDSRCTKAGWRLGPCGKGARFREVVLLDARQAAAERFDQRAREDDDPWVQFHHRNVVELGGSEVLGLMYDNLIEVLRSRPAAVVVPSAPGAVHETYELVLNALA